MDANKIHVNPNPMEKANVLSLLTFSYTFPMFKKGYTKDLDVDDLYNPIPADRSKHLGDRLASKWLNQLKKCEDTKEKPSLMKTLVLTFWPEYLYLGILAFFLDVVLRLSLPILLGRTLSYFDSSSTTTKSEALWYVTVLITINLLTCLVGNQYVLGCFQYGMRVRASCCSLIYRKALKLSRSALGETASGQIVNLLSNDVSRFDMVSIFLGSMWTAPLILLIATYFLYSTAGISGLVGIAPIFLISPLQSYAGKLSAKYRKQTALKTDERVRLMDEIICGIQVIKMYAWERPFAKLIKYTRKSELNIIIKSSYVRGLYMTFAIFTTRSALYCTLVAMVLSQQELTAATVYVLMFYYNLLSQTFTTLVVRGISEIAELFVAIERLQNFLSNDEYVTQTPFRGDNSCDSISYDTELILDNVTARWDPKSSDNTLKNISLTLRKGDLFGIMGPVGSGKSSLLETILGELVITSGNKIVNGVISYASQEPWVFSASIRQNILFGSEYHKMRYNEVVRVCCLEKDFKQFPQGDLTLVGDRGSLLSGGQKARINLARAVYREADIYLLDDPLSAVDIHVSKHLYEECINGFLEKKAKILVTHQVHYLKNAHSIAVLENGKIVCQGTSQDLISLDNVYSRLLTSEIGLVPDEKTKTSIETPRIIRSFSRKLSIGSAVSEMSIPETLLIEDAEEEQESRDFKEMQEESSKGKVKGSLFFNYLTSGNNFCVVFSVITLLFLTQALSSGFDYFISFWVNIEEQRNSEVFNTVQTNIFNLPFKWTTELCVYFAGFLVVSLLILALVRSFFYYIMAMSSSQTLHDNMFHRIISTPMLFFEKNPGGRILNRFSKDIGSIDELLPKVILDASQLLLSLVGSLVLVAIVNPYFLIFVVGASVVFLFIRNIFLKSSTNIKRLEGIMRSPVFSHLGASINGLTTIRAFSAQDILTKEFDKHQDYHTGAWFMYMTASSAYGFSMDFICLVFVGIVTFSLLLLQSEYGLEAGQVGLAITQAMSLTGLVQWAMRQSAEITNNLLSVERVLEYDTLEPEVEPENPLKPPVTWPQHGKITFRDMGLRYSEDSPLVLKHLNIVINPREKVGVVGRTGAGKSSLISALFRLMPIEGHIDIDEIDTKNLSLHTLRSKLSIIPQDPVLFSGTLRYNLDPFEEYDDNVLYKAINEVELKDPANIMNKLETRVMDRGSNYSVGQRQLICLARAIIRNNRILLLDEATANVDPETDRLIQKTIRTKFAHCTVLTVAHRLNTIMDSDKVLVMDSGTVIEFDHPYILLQNTSGVFYKMVMETGKGMSDQLKKLAKQSYQILKVVPEEK